MNLLDRLHNELRGEIQRLLNPPEWFLVTLQVVGGVAAFVALWINGWFRYPPGIIFWSCVVAVWALSLFLRARR